MNVDDGVDRQERVETTPSQQLLEELLRGLLAGTCAEALGWEVDDGHADSFCATGSEWLVATRSVDADGQAPYALLLAEPSGEPLLEVRSNSAYGRPIVNLFGDLHRAAAASAEMSESVPLISRIVQEVATLEGLSAKLTPEAEVV